MAWLITLALFLWIGGAIASTLDKSRYKTQQRKQTKDNEIKAIKGNIYTIAWQHCLDLQLEYLKERPTIPSNETLPYHYTMTHGSSLQKLSVIYALEDLRRRNQPVIRIINGNASIVQSTESYDVQEEAESVRGALDPIYGPFSMPCACKVSDEKAIAIAKPIWGRQVLGTNIVKWDRETGRIMY
nr:MAG TPA: hypothetical protein [Caudoviricetes sp.]